MEVRRHKAFSLLELLVCIAVTAVLLGLLLPLLLHARSSGYQVVCANNLRQISVGWTSYLQDHRDVFPSAPVMPEWRYGGATFVGPDRRPMLAMDRPINPYLVDEESELGSAELARLFQCPEDHGVTQRAGAERGRPGPSILANASCFQFFGTSYRANPRLMNSTLAGIDTQARPIKLHEIHIDPSRMLLTGDAAWHYATSPRPSSDSLLEASWHGQDAGNMLAVDGSIRYIEFGQWPTVEFAINPRPE